MGTPQVRIDYTNHRGERTFRVIEPDRFFYGVSDAHREPQWQLVAFCRERSALRTFALRNIHSWQEIEP